MRTNQAAGEFQPTLSLGFDYSPPADLATQVTTRLQHSKRLALPQSVQVEVQDGTATLVGTAASQHDRQLIEQMLALEPGIRRVDNRLTVNPVAPPSSPAAQ
ncbi:MAG: BON domain-containing protein [Pirellulales bacterium]|nr:BON domain-containing protein [Pirellulales bacterium]